MVYGDTGTTGRSVEIVDVDDQERKQFSINDNDVYALAQQALTDAKILYLSARIRHISAQKTLADRKTAELEPRDRFSHDWAEQGVDILEQAE